MDNSAEIDLYDNIEEDFVQENNELNDLYDDILPPSQPEQHKNESTVRNTSSTQQPAHTGKRCATYLGNLTWWTTDVDIKEAFASIGINDILEIKFHENRQNGQSKGFCVVVFGSEASVKTGMEKIPSVKIHDATPVLTNCTKQNLAHFEKSASNEISSQSSSGAGLLGSSTSNSITFNSSNGRLPPPLMSATALPTPLGFSARGSTSLMGQASTGRSSSNRNLPMGIANMTQGLQTLLMSNLNLPANLSGNPGAGLISAPQLSLPGSSGTNAHINPNFLQPGVQNQGGVLGSSPLFPGNGLRAPLDQIGGSILPNFPTGSGLKLSDAEFEDLVERNRTISSAAINRALQDANSGNFSKAIEAIVTAMSLIKQSKVANDDRTKVLLQSLQNALRGIEMKSYGSGNEGRRRRRSYSNSGSDGGGDGYGSGSRRRRSRHRSTHRHRSRSPRNSRSRDRHHRSSREYYSNSSNGYEPSNRYRQ